MSVTPPLPPSIHPSLLYDSTSRTTPMSCQNDASSSVIDEVASIPTSRTTGSSIRPPPVVVQPSPLQLVAPRITQWNIHCNNNNNNDNNEKNSNNDNSLSSNNSPARLLTITELPYGYNGIGTGGRVWHSGVLLVRWLAAEANFQQHNSSNKQCQMLDNDGGSSTTLFDHNNNNNNSASSSSLPPQQQKQKQQQQPPTIGRRVLELGCGTGFVGLYAALFGIASEVIVLTDHDPIALDNCRANLVANSRQLQQQEQEQQEQQKEHNIKNLPTAAAAASDGAAGGEDGNNKSTNKNDIRRAVVRVEHLDWSECQQQQQQQEQQQQQQQKPHENNKNNNDDDDDDTDKLHEEDPLSPILFDCILAADCVYEDNVEDFVDAIATHLAMNGTVMAVLRERDGSGGNLYYRALSSCCQTRGLEVKVATTAAAAATTMIQNEKNQADEKEEEDDEEHYNKISNNNKSIADFQITTMVVGDDEEKDNLMGHQNNDEIILNKNKKNESPMLTAPTTFDSGPKLDRTFILITIKWKK